MPSLPGRRCLPRQQGFTFMLLLLLLGVGAGAALLSFFSTTALTLENDRKTADALARAKAALIAYAVKNGDIAGTARPGDFLCPDTDNDGNANSPCGGAVSVALGRVPWKNLGIPEPKDAAGETLWYAVANPFRTNPPNGAPINSDTRGNITVFAPDGVTQLTTQAVAVIFAPGPVLAGQNRDPNPFLLALCPTTGTFIRPILCAANYLEISNGVNNADFVPPTGPFIAGLRSASYNDRVLFITTTEFMPAVEMRVAKELRTWLEGYRANSACACYPWADSFAAADGTSDDGVNRGRMPLTARPEDWGDGTIPLPNPWFFANNWYNLIYYSVARLSTDGGGGSCTTCVDNDLSFNGAAGVNALFFTPGTPLGAIVRPSNNLADYLENAQNNDGANDLYVTPTATALDRDRITIFPGASTQQCANNAAALLALAPCGQPPKLNPQCVAYAANLAVCTCAAAGNQIITPPCQNTLLPVQCQSAVVTLRACNS